MIDFEALNRADIEVVNTELTERDKREISAFLKAHREKQAKHARNGTQRKASARKSTKQETTRR